MDFFIEGIQQREKIITIEVKIQTLIKEKFKFLKTLQADDESRYLWTFVAVLTFIGSLLIVICSC